MIMMGGPPMPGPSRGLHLAEQELEEPLLLLPEEL